MNETHNRITFKKTLLDTISVQNILDAVDGQNEDLYITEDSSELLNTVLGVMVNRDACDSVAQYLLEIHTDEDTKDNVDTKDWENAKNELIPLVEAAAELYKPTLAEYAGFDD